MQQLGHDRIMGMPDSRCTVTVHVQPNAGRNKVVKFENQVLYLRLAAPPVNGKANEALIRHLSDTLHVAKSNVSIKRGLAGRNKTVEIVGIDPERFRTLVDEALRSTNR